MKLVLVAVFIAFWLHFPASCSAVITITADSPPSEILVSDEFSLPITLTGAATEYFLSGSFFEPETTKYFGEVKNSTGAWVKSSATQTELFSLPTNGTYTVSFRVGEQPTHFEPNKIYQFKLRRFTTGGSYSWVETPEPWLIFVSEATQSATPEIVSPTSTTTVTAETTAAATSSPASLQISEFAACPTQGNSEWIELFNPEATSVSLSGWSVSDGQHSKTLTGSVPANGYLTVTFSNSILNNSGDTIQLLTPASVGTDQVSYTSCSAELSWSKINNSWQQSLIFTPNAPNILLKPTSTPTATLKLSSPTQSLTPSIRASLTPTITLRPVFSVTPPPLPTVLFPTPLLPPSTDQTGQVLGDSTNQSAENTTPQTEQASFSQRNGILLFIGGGALLLLSSGILLMKAYQDGLLANSFDSS